MVVWLLFVSFVFPCEGIDVDMDMDMVYTLLEQTVVCSTLLI